jgi:hypothetical protein
MRAAIVLVLTAFALGCEDTAEPTPASVSGVYEAVAFTTSTDGTVIDHLAAGADLEITLAGDGTTTGVLFIPDADEGGGDFQADLAGSWTLDDGIVTFDHAADTFVRDMPFEYRDGRLLGDATFSGARVQVTLAGSD